MWFRKNKTDKIKALKYRVAELKKALSESEHRYATEIGKLAKAQMEWQSKAESFIAYRANIQEAWKQVKAKNDADQFRTGAVAGQLDYVSQQLSDANKNIIHGKRHLGN